MTQSSDRAWAEWLRSADAREVERLTLGTPWSTDARIDGPLPELGEMFGLRAGDGAGCWCVTMSTLERVEDDLRRARRKFRATILMLVGAWAAIAILLVTR
jgi:hypothetical protein